jgi:hypothetical protein
MKTQRLILNVTPEALKQLKDLAADKANGKVSEVIRQAIAIYVRIVNEQKNDPHMSVELVPSPQATSNTRAKLVLPWN